MTILILSILLSMLRPADRVVPYDAPECAMAACQSPLAGLHAEPLP
jgi:hypothetical protein